MGGELVRAGMPGLWRTADFSYQPNFLDDFRAFRLLRSLWAETKWQQQKITLFGREVAQPRLTSWQGDEGVCYSYSGLKMVAGGWNTALSCLRNELEQELGVEFNSVLLNAYRNGRDSMGWHSDDEKELGSRPVIASISLGSSRRFLLRGRSAKESVAFWLEHGSLLVMSGNSQSEFRHSLPKTARRSGLRINLTFRKVFSE